MSCDEPGVPRYYVPIEGEDGQRAVMVVGERVHRTLERLIRDSYGDFGIDDVKFTLPPVKKPVKLVSKKPFLDTGYVWAPYIPVMKPIPPIDDINVKGVMTRYATKVVRPDFYGTVSIMDDGGFKPLPEKIELPKIKNVIPGTIQSLWEPGITGCAAPTVIADPSRYPHQCTRCGAPAYIGFMSIDCSRKSCS